MCHSHYTVSITVISTVPIETGVSVTWRLQVMGLTKQYLRYVASAVFGVIGSQKANITYVTLRGGERGRYVAVAACEHVFIWDVRKGEKVRFC